MAVFAKVGPKTAPTPSAGGQPIGSSVNALRHSSQFIL
jgi:hypothetical protein